MSHEAKPGHGYALAPDDLAAQVAALTKIGDQTENLINSASQLAERLPKLGTAPPAVHLAMRLRDAAGQTGLRGAVSAASTELNNFHQALRQTVTGYLDNEVQVVEHLHNAGRHGGGSR